MRHINLIATVLRASPQCVGTFAVNDKQAQSVAEYLADHAQARHHAARIAEGLASDHVSYEREYIDTEVMESEREPVKGRGGFPSKGKSKS